MKPFEFGRPTIDRTTRIETLRREIASGSYRVDSSALAQAMIEHMQQKHRLAA